MLHRIPNLRAALSQGHGNEAAVRAGQAHAACTLEAASCTRCRKWLLTASRHLQRFH